MLIRETDGWAVTQGELPAAGEKRAGVEGPIRDAYMEPLTFVYGAGSPRTARANRELANAFAERYGGSARYPVIPDSGAIPSTGAMFLVGSPADHALLRRFGKRLPITVDGAALVLGNRRYEARDVGALFVWPNPDDPSRALVVLTAPSPNGIWRAKCLPKLLPDFVVFDRRVAAAAGEQILGPAKVLAAGFFNERWSGPELIEPASSASSSAPPTAKPPADAAAPPAP
jgi:hypothetical protein